MEVVETGRSPVLHINIIHVLRQRMPIVAPLDSPYAVSRDISTIRLVPPDHVTPLLEEFVLVRRFCRSLYRAAILSNGLLVN